MRHKQTIAAIWKAADWKERLGFFISTTFFSGMLGKNGKGGGTYGSIVAALIQIGMLHYGMGLNAYLAVALVTLMVGFVAVYYGESAMRRAGQWIRHTGESVKEDFNQTNWDEFHGMFLASTPVFMYAEDSRYDGWTYEVLAIVLSFALFRLFDVKKPWPIRSIEENYPGPIGIMLDDSAAGFLAAVVLMVLQVILTA